MSPMRLAAIYNVFSDSIEILPYSLNCLKGFVEEIIIVHQDISNFGEKGVPIEKYSDYFIKNMFPGTNFTYVKYSPNVSYGGMTNEARKRNLGIDCAKALGCTHFLSMDSDELYEDFGQAKKQYIDSGAKGSVVQMYTYFKKPTLRFANVDSYFAPFIHELKPDTVVGNGRYPFYCDPTRKPNEQNVALIKEKLHHFSYVRKDINLKIRNSSARANIEKSTILKDYNNPEVGEGFYVEAFRQKLISVPNIFNIEI